MLTGKPVETKDWPVARQGCGPSFPHPRSDAVRNEFAGRTRACYFPEFTRDLVLPPENFARSHDQTFSWCLRESIARFLWTFVIVIGQRRTPWRKDVSFSRRFERVCYAATPQDAIDCGLP